MRLFCTLLLLSFLVACKQDRVYKAYDPYHKVLTLRELGNQDELVQKLYLAYEAKPISQAQKDQNLIIDYLTEHKISATKLPSGVYFKVYKYGNGSRYYMGRQFSARYTGYLLDGKVFDSNLEANHALKMNVGEMIQGWNEALTQVSTGAKVSIFIPSHLAYGTRGVKSVVPPNAVLIFDVELG